MPGWDVCETRWAWEAFEDFLNKNRYCQTMSKGPEGEMNWASKDRPRGRRRKVLSSTSLRAADVEARPPVAGVGSDGVRRFPLTRVRPVFCRRSFGGFGEVIH